MNVPLPSAEAHDIDEVVLLRRLRPDVPPPGPAAWASARARLLAVQAEIEPAVFEPVVLGPAVAVPGAADSLRDQPYPLGADVLLVPSARRRRRRLVLAALVGSGLAAGAVGLPLLLGGGAPGPRPAPALVPAAAATSTAIPAPTAPSAAAAASSAERAAREAELTAKLRTAPYYYVRYRDEVPPQHGRTPSGHENWYVRKGVAGLPQPPLLPGGALRPDVFDLVTETVTWDQLAALPTEPEALYRHLLQVAGNAGTSPRAKLIAVVHSFMGKPTTPALRHALAQVTLHAPGVHDEGLRTDELGREVRSLRYDLDGVGERYFLEVGSDALVGVEALTREGYVGPIGTGGSAAPVTPGTLIGRTTILAEGPVNSPTQRVP